LGAGQRLRFRSYFLVYGGSKGGGRFDGGTSKHQSPLYQGYVNIVDHTVYAPNVIVIVVFIGRGRSYEIAGGGCQGSGGCRQARQGTDYCFYFVEDLGVVVVTGAERRSPSRLTIGRTNNKKYSP
jgi:hypothetical protein